MIKVAIVEDNTDDQELLKKHIERFQSEEGIEIQYKTFKNGILFLQAYKQNFDIVLMDIEMPAMDGMETARRLRELNQDIPLIFITNMAQFAVKGYDVDAMGFFIKPVQYLDFYYRFKKVLKIIEPGQISISIKTESGLKMLSIADIQYLEVEDNWVTYHTKLGNYKTRITLTAAEIPLKEAGSFIRCNNCYLVNLQYVTEVKLNAVVVAGDTLLISRHKKKEFMNALTAYLGGKK